MIEPLKEAVGDSDIDPLIDLLILAVTVLHADADRDPVEDPLPVLDGLLYGLLDDVPLLKLE